MLTDAALEQLSELLEKNVDLTLAEIKEHFCMQCSLLAIHKTVVTLGLVFKKTLRASEQEREEEHGKVSNGANLRQKSNLAA